MRMNRHVNLVLVDQLVTAELNVPAVGILGVMQTLQRVLLVHLDIPALMVRGLRA